MPEANDTATANYPRIETKYLLFYASIFVAAPILTYVLGKFLDSIFLLPRFPPLPINLILGSIIFCIGLAIGIKATRTLFKRGQGLPWGELDGQSQSRMLITNGIYAYTRNPMVLGYCLLPCGMGIMFRSISMTVLIPATILLVTAWVAKTREEPNLEKRFGDAYLEYKENTPFLIPRLRPLLLSFTLLLFALRKERKLSKLVHVCNLQTVFYSITLLSFSIVVTRALTSQSGGVQAQKEVVGAALVAICILSMMAGISHLHHKRKEH